MKKRITTFASVIFALVMMASLVIPAFADDSRLLYSDIDTFTQEEQDEISNYLYDLSEDEDCDVVCLCISSLMTYDGGRYTEDMADSIADDYYSENNIGRGTEGNAVIAVWIADAESEINGINITAYGEKFDHDDAVGICDEYSYNYQAGSSDSDKSEYYLKCMAFCNGFEAVADGHEYVTESDGNGYVVSGEENYETQHEFEWIKYILIAVVTGAVIGFIIATVLKSQLKSVRRQSGAANYVVGGSFKVEKSNDVFLYKKLEKTAKPKQQKPPEK